MEEMGMVMFTDLFCGSLLLMKLERKLDYPEPPSKALALTGLVLALGLHSNEVMAGETACGSSDGWTDGIETWNSRVVVIEGSYTPDQAIQLAKDKVRNEGRKCGATERRFVTPLGSTQIKVTYPIPFKDTENHYEINVDYSEVISKKANDSGKDATTSWYGFSNSTAQDRETELKVHCSPFYQRVHVDSGASFNDLCSSIGKTCKKVCDWEGNWQSCSDSSGGRGDGSRIAVCE